MKTKLNRKKPLQKKRPVKKSGSDGLLHELETQKMDALARFAGSVAHDFNNMMMIVRGYSDLLLRKISTDDVSRPKIEAIHKVSQGAVQLTGKLLAFGQRQLLQPQTINLNEHLKGVLNMIQELLGKKISLATRFSNDPVLVKVDRFQLNETIVNIVTNARDAMPNGGELILEIANVKLGPEQAAKEGITTGEYGLLSFTDTGSGMTPEVQKRVFEPFFTTRDHAPGKGLGLSTVYGIIKQSDGHITVASKMGKGSTVKIHLLKWNEAPEVQSDKKREVEDVSGKGETILVVENREGLLQMVSEILAEQGYTVFQAQNGHEALRLCESGTVRINLLFTDILMPKMTGLELSEKLRVIIPKIKIVFTSGYSQDAVFQEKVNKGEIHFIAKPYNSVILAKKIREVLDSTE